MSRDKNIFNCFGDCHASGKVIDLAVVMEGGEKGDQDDVRSAALKLQGWFGLESERPKGGKRKPPQPQLSPDVEVSITESDELAKDKEVPEPQAEADHAAEAIPAKVNPPLRFALMRLDPDHPYLASRGFTKDTLASFGLGLYPKGIMAGRIAIPIHNERGELVAYAGRVPGDPLEGEGKYKFPTGFKKSLVV